MNRKQTKPAASTKTGDSSHISPRSNGKKKSDSYFPSFSFCFALIFVVVIAIFAQYIYYYKIYLPKRISTKSNLPLIDFKYDSQKWGTHRPHMYFGLRTPHQSSPLFGMIWYRVEDIYGNFKPRHWCDQGDGLKRYGWINADGRTFGHQIIEDRSLKIQTDWMNKDYSWSARISTALSDNTTAYAFIFYFALQDASSAIDTSHEKLSTESSFLTKFVHGNSFDFIVNTTIPLDFRSYYAARYSPYPKAELLLNMILSETSSNAERRLSYLSNQIAAKNSNFVALQFILTSNSSIEISFAPINSPFSAEDFSATFQTRIDAFNEKFEKTYGLAEKGYDSIYLQLGRTALSNLLGSIGFSYGYNKVIGHYSDKTSLYGPHSLLTACPSRSRFSRGFLWDEGFHHIIIRKYDADLSLQIISSWLDTMNIDGWIPREMILDSEAEQRVPSEFVVQKDSVANPPMFYFLIDKILDDEELMKSHMDAIKKMYPRLKLWYNWLNTTQSGPIPGTYRWRGRNQTTDLELNPLTLPSGLDDFPRATHPTDQEYHIDLRCWMAFSARILKRLAKIHGKKSDEALYAATFSYLSDFDSLNRLHWSEEAHRYCDYGSHSISVSLKRPKRNYPDESTPELKRIVRTPPQYSLVTNTFGYISLFPLMLRLLPHDSLQLKVTLEQMRSENEIWSPYGLRSISASSPYYHAYNTEHNSPYWRGAIWLNINYMVLSALKHYSYISGPNQELVFKIYSELRNNIVVNMAKEFRRTSYIWESYDDVNGYGRGAHPFTGWSSLVLSIMAEQYD